VLEVLAAVLLIVLLTPALGLEGLALAGLVANVATGLAWFVPAACRQARVEPLRYLSRGLLRPLVAALPACALGALLAPRLPPGLWPLAGAAAVTGAAGLAGALALGATRRDRLRCLAVARRLAGARP
jgi:O-antigen/teichoic acid export membrane protein